MSDGVVSVLLKRYYNGHHTFTNGTYCDGIGNAKMLSECDNWFEMCLKTYTSSFESKACDYIGNTFVLGGDDFAFPAGGSSIGINVTNPLIFQFKGRWPVRISIFCIHFRLFR